MNLPKQQTLVITDGSQGMISQVFGLAKQFNYKINSIETKLIFPWSIMQPGFLPIFRWIFKNEIQLTFNPKFIISCGRKSVYLSIFFKKKYKNSICIHIQNPKINFNKFNYIIAPTHDNIKGLNVIESIGALHHFDQQSFEKNLDLNFKIPKKNLISIIIGGSNNHYKFTIIEIKNLILKIKKIKKNYPTYNFLILPSRRTTKEMKDLLELNLKEISIIWKKEEKNPYTFALKYSNYFIVTSDSTSMISECAFTGKPIYIFDLPFKRKSKRMERFHRQFKKLNITQKLNDNLIFKSWSYDSLNESKRIASILKERIIKENNELK